MVRIGGFHGLLGLRLMGSNQRCVKNAFLAFRLLMGQKIVGELRQKAVRAHIRTFAFKLRNQLVAKLLHYLIETFVDHRPSLDLMILGRGLLPDAEPLFSMTFPLAIQRS